MPLQCSPHLLRSVVLSEAPHICFELSRSMARSRSIPRMFIACMQRQGVRTKQHGENSLNRHRKGSNPVPRLAGRPINSPVRFQGALHALRNKCRVKNPKNNYSSLPKARGPRRAWFWLDGVEIRAQRSGAPHEDFSLRRRRKSLAQVRKPWVNVDQPWLNVQ